MATKNLDKLITKIKDEHLVKKSVKATQKREFGEGDILKHFIRKKFWEKRIKLLRRDIKPALDEGVKYFSLCSKYAFDTRLFIKEKIINTTNPKKGFVFCEFDKDDFLFLHEVFLPKRISRTGQGFKGSLADIAIDTTTDSYGRFWSCFPFDVINLDYYGDIFKTDNDKIGINDFSTIQAIVSHQAKLRRQYELWITMRAKSNRIPEPIKHDFTKIIEENIKTSTKFSTKFSQCFSGVTEVGEIHDEKLYYIGFLKWLFYVCNSSFSVIKNIEILKYSREDKDDEEYNIYNILIRIEPFPNISIPSPVGEAAEHCNAQYLKCILKSLDEPTDIHSEFSKLSKTEKKLLSDELEVLNNEFDEDQRGHF